MPGNPHDSYDLVLTTHPMAPFFEQKKKLWKSVGLDSVSTIPLTLSAPLPESVLKYLRIQRMDEADLAAAILRGNSASFDKISHSNEVEILSFLVESVSSLIDTFEPQLEKLESQLAEDFYPSGGNAWAAAHVSLGEQRVLRLTRKSAEELLASENGSSLAKSASSTINQCANCGNSISSLMRCGRCNETLYCGRTCQVAHYKEHKAICRATVARKGPSQS